MTTEAGVVTQVDRHVAIVQNSYCDCVHCREHGLRPRRLPFPKRFITLETGTLSEQDLQQYLESVLDTGQPWYEKVATTYICGYCKNFKQQIFQQLANLLSLSLQLHKLPKYSNLTDVTPSSEKKILQKNGFKSPDDGQLQIHPNRPWHDCTVEGKCKNPSPVTRVSNHIATCKGRLCRPYKWDCIFFVHSSLSRLQDIIRHQS